jgi:hypothetical protein
MLTPAGALLGRCHWSRQHVGRRVAVQHHVGHQLFGVAVEEELAKRKVALHQVDYGVRFFFSVLPTDAPSAPIRVF